MASLGSAETKCYCFGSFLKFRKPVPCTTFTVAGFATPQALLDQIAIERRIELLGEGFRSIDRLRLGETLVARGPIRSVTPADAQYIWPIPLSELLVNKAVTQNPGH